MIDEKLEKLIKEKERIQQAIMNRAKEIELLQADFFKTEGKIELLKELDVEIEKEESEEVDGSSEAKPDN